MSGPKPAVKWYVQLVEDDTHDEDIAMPPQLFTGTIGGKQRALLMATDKGGDYAIIDRTNGTVVSHGQLVQNQGMDTPPTADGQVGCPNHGGGVEWNVGAYDAATNMFLIPATDECGVWTSLPGVQYSAGHPYSGGILPARGGGVGIISAVDVTGTELWSVATGSSIVAPPVAYPIDGKEIIAVISGEAGNQATKEIPRTNKGSFTSAFAIR